MLQLTILITLFIFTLVLSEKSVEKRLKKGLTK